MASARKPMIESDLAMDFPLLPSQTPGGACGFVVGREGNRCLRRP
jgi:hypothetical protein